MFARHSAAVYEFLKTERLLETAQLDDAYCEHAASGRPFAEILIERRLVPRRVLLERVAARHGYEFLPELPEQFPGEAIAAVRGPLARECTIMPWRLEGARLDVLVADPFAVEQLDSLPFAVGREVRFFFADPVKIEAKICQHYGADEERLDIVLHETDGHGLTMAATNESSARDLAAMAQQAPIVKFVNLVLSQAVDRQASDVHFEPFEHEFKIRYRVDGALYELAPPPSALALPIISRIKVLADLNIAERRVPQDGRMSLRVGDRSVDLRVSTLPTQFGESVVLRVLDQSAVRLDITELGMPSDVLAGVREIVRRPNGIFIVTGPTGSGKTTTLYSGLRVINTPDLKILTAEDPVEYEIEGLMQTAINPAIGLTFASALRSFLRQDPDVIMVGEIRDLATAQIAIQAALTGHLVLTTLHTNDAAGAVTRLIDMGVEPFLIASTLEAVLAQRLVRTICAHCRTTYVPEVEAIEALGDVSLRHEARASRGRGCPACNYSGYRGRMGIYEWLPLTEPLRDLVARCAPTFALRQKALEQGMHSLREAGVQAVREGRTSIEEVLRYT